MTVLYLCLLPKVANCKISTDSQESCAYVFVSLNSPVNKSVWDICLFKENSQSKIDIHLRFLNQRDQINYSGQIL